MHPTEKKNVSRRHFIKNTSIVAGSFFIMPRHVLGRGFTAPSDKLNIAGVGCGGKAEVNLPYAFNNGAENIVALCDVDDRMSVKAREKWPTAPYYKDYREMLDKEARHVDAVMVTTPDHMHAVAHVWTNRPVWPQGIATPTGKFEIPKELNWDLWLGTAPQRDFNPTYLPATWRGWADFGTGSLGDMGCHFIDVPYRALKLGYPIAVECSVGQVWTGFFHEAVYTDSYPPSSKIHIHFPAREKMVPVELIWYDGGIKPERPTELLPDEEMGEWDGGIIFEGTRGKLMAGLFGRNATLLPTSKMKGAKFPEAKKPFVEGGSEGHQTQWVNACKKGYGTYTSSSFDEAGPLTETVLMGNLAVRSYNYSEKNAKGDTIYPGRKKLLWDGANMKITNFDPANQFVKRSYRGNWKLDL